MAAAQSFSVGSIDCRLVRDGHALYAPEMTFANVAGEELEGAVKGFVGERGMLPVPYNCLLIRAGGKQALVDAGLGQYAAAFDAPAGRLQVSLEAEGVAPDEVDLVLISHGHPDHIGGLTFAGEPVFANARHILSRDEWAFWTSEETLRRLPEAMTQPAREQLSRLDAAGLLDLSDAEREVLPGVRLLAAPGHTPGHTAIEIRAEREGAIFLADVVLHELNFAHPDWVSAVETIPERTVETRLQLLGRAAEEGAIVAAYHLEAPGRVEKVGTGFRFERLGSSALPS